MKISNYTPKENQQLELNKWYIGLHLLKYPEYQFYQGFALRPVLRIFCFKLTKYPPLNVISTDENYKGFMWQFKSPLGIQINLI